jgi:hypothetical protein
MLQVPGLGGLVGRGSGDELHVNFTTKGLGRRREEENGNRNASILALRQRFLCYGNGRIQILFILIIPTQPASAPSHPKHKPQTIALTIKRTIASQTQPSSHL